MIKKVDPAPPGLAIGALAIGALPRRVGRLFTSTCKASATSPSAWPGSACRRRRTARCPVRGGRPVASGGERRSTPPTPQREHEKKLPSDQAAATFCKVTATSWALIRAKGSSLFFFFFFLNGINLRFRHVRTMADCVASSPAHTRAPPPCGLAKTAFLVRSLQDEPALKVCTGEQEQPGGSPSSRCGVRVSAIRTQRTVGWSRPGHGSQRKVKLDDLHFFQTVF